MRTLNVVLFFCRVGAQPLIAEGILHYMLHSPATSIPATHPPLPVHFLTSHTLPPGSDSSIKVVFYFAAQQTEVECNDALRYEWIACAFVRLFPFQQENMDTILYVSTKTTISSSNRTEKRELVVVLLLLSLPCQWNGNIRKLVSLLKPLFYYGMPATKVYFYSFNAFSTLFPPPLFCALWRLLQCVHVHQHQYCECREKEKICRNLLFRCHSEYLLEFGASRIAAILRTKIFIHAIHTHHIHTIERCDVEWKCRKCITCKIPPSGVLPNIYGNKRSWKANAMNVAKK